MPADAKSLALTVDDPDAPDPAALEMTWVDWGDWHRIVSRLSMDQMVQRPLTDCQLNKNDPIFRRHTLEWKSSIEADALEIRVTVHVTQAKPRQIELPIRKRSSFKPYRESDLAQSA